MLPVLTESAKKQQHALQLGHLDRGRACIAPDVLKRFPYDEHPRTLALVLGLTDELGIPATSRSRRWRTAWCPTSGS